MAIGQGRIGPHRPIEGRARASAKTVPDNTRRFGSCLDTLPIWLLAFIFSDVEGGWSGTGDWNIAQDPLFLGVPDNLHIQDNSPCKETGTTGYMPNYVAPTDDIEGTPRPSCGGHDMGAQEYQCPPAP